jgi:hypothetical protein
MVTLIKVGLVIALLLVLIRKKVDLGLALALDSLLVAALFGLRPRRLGLAALEGLTSDATLELVGIVLPSIWDIPRPETILGGWSSPCAGLFATRVSSWPSLPPCWGCCR